MADNTITVTRGQIAKMIDHSLLHPTMTDAETLEGLRLSRRHGVAAACVKPYAVSAAVAELSSPAAAADAGGSSSSDVLVCAVVGFPHGNSTVSIKAAEAAEAAAAGAREIDVVVNVGKVLGGDWAYVADEISRVARAAAAENAATATKVIFENDFLREEHIARLCEVCSAIPEVAFVKTSTGYGFVKGEAGTYSYKGATVPHLRLMRERAHPRIQVKAAGGVRSLDDLLHVRSLGVSRIGATATEAIMREAERRGITDQPTTVAFKPMGDAAAGGY